MVAVQRPPPGKRAGVRAISQHSSQTACEGAVRWTADSSPRVRARSKRCANARGPAIRINKRLCSPRALHLPHLYQGALLPVGSIATAAGLSEPPGSHRDHLVGVRTPTPQNGDTGGVARGTGSPGGTAPVAGEPPSVLSPAQKVEHLFRIFDVDQDALLCYSELRAFLSALAEKEWDDRLRFEEWCILLKADSSLGLSSQDFGKLLSLERSFLDDSFRILGLESLGAKVLSPTAVLRTELLRRALDSNLALAPLLSSSWRGDFQRLLASELLIGISGIGCAGGVAAAGRGFSPTYMVTAGSDSQEAFLTLLSAVHDVVEAAGSAAERWYGCFQGYLRRAALDRSVEEWAAFDATWGAKIATLMAQVRAVESLQQEVADLADASKPELLWRYARGVLELMPTMELSKPNGLVMPTAQIAALESAARRVQTGGSQSPQRNPEAAVQPVASPPRSPGLRRPYRQKRPFERPLRGWAGRPFKSAPATPVDRHLKPVSASSPVDRPVKSVPATPVQQGPSRQAVRDAVPGDFASEKSIQPPKEPSGRSGKRPLATRQAAAAPPGTNDEAADVEAQADHSPEVEADALAVQKDELNASLDEAGPEGEALDAAALPNDDNAYDDETYEDYEEEGEQEERSSGQSSTILQQQTLSTQDPTLSTCSQNDESRDVVEPLPAERCGSSAVESAVVGNGDSLRSVTPASNATYEMDFDSEDGNAAVDLPSDDAPARAEGTAGTDGEQEQENPKEAGAASGNGSMTTLQSDTVDDAANLKEDIAAEMRANAVLAAEMHGFNKDVKLAKKPLGDDDNDNSDDEEDFFEDARRAAHREEAELAGKPLRSDEDDDEEEEDFLEDARKAARRGEVQQGPEVSREAEVSGPDPELACVDTGKPAEQEPVVETEQAPDQAIRDVAMGAIAQLQIADNLTNAEEMMLDADIVGADSAFASVFLDDHDSCEAAGVLAAAEISQSMHPDVQRAETLAVLEDNNIGDSAAVAATSESTHQDLQDADAPIALDSDVGEAAAAAAASESPHEDPQPSPEEEKPRVEPQCALAHGDQAAGVRSLLRAIYSGVKPDPAPVDTGIQCEMLPQEGGEEEAFLEREAMSEELPVEKQATSEELPVETQAVVATSAHSSSRNSTSSESDVECFTTEIPSRQVSKEPDAEAQCVEVQQRYLVDNSTLCADAEGISYRSAKDLSARLEPEDVALWNSFIHGFDEGDEWVRVPAKSAYLPSVVKGIRVLTKCDEADAERKGSRHSTACGSSVWELDFDAELQPVDPKLGFLRSCGADGSTARYGKLYDAGEALSLPASNRESRHSSAVAETMSLPPESTGSIAEPDSRSMAESRNSSDEFSAELLSQALP